jgi:transcriptional regulator with XRE-family HTH domain
MRPQHPIRPHLRAWRLAKGATLVWLAEQLGRTHTSVMRWESGASGVDDATFEAIARVYGISASELSAPPADAERARELGRVMDAIRHLDADALRTLAQTAELLRRPRT